MMHNNHSYINLIRLPGNIVFELMYLFLRESRRACPASAGLLSPITPATSGVIEVRMCNPGAVEVVSSTPLVL